MEDILPTVNLNNTYTSQRLQPENRPQNQQDTRHISNYKELANEYDELLEQIDQLTLSL